MTSAAGGSPRRAAWWVDVAIVAAIAAVIGITFRGSLNSDSMWAVVWGREVLEGRVPEASVMTPVPHSLSIAVSALAAIPGDTAAYHILVAAGVVSLATVAWGAFRLGQLLASTAVGVLAALAVSSSLLFIHFGAASVSVNDVPFVALVVIAAVLEARRRRRGTSVLVLLALAGLLRPEAWPLGGAYAIYLWPGASWRRRAGHIALAAAPVAIWVATHLILGAPLFGLRAAIASAPFVLVAGAAGFAFRRRLPVSPAALVVLVVLVVFAAAAVAQALAPADASPGYETGVVNVPEALVRGLRDTYRPPIVLGGLLGLAIALVAARGRGAVPLAVAGLGAFSFAVLGALEMPLDSRFVLLPAAMLAIFFAFAALGWWTRADRWRAPWATLGVLLLVSLLPFLPSQATGIAAKRDGAHVIGGAIEDLRTLMADAGDRARCSPLTAPAGFLVPYVAHASGHRPEHVQSAERESPPKRGLVVVAVDLDVATALYGSEDHVAPPPGFRRLGENRSWALYERGC